MDLITQEFDPENFDQLQCSQILENMVARANDAALTMTHEEVRETFSDFFTD